MTSLKNLQHWLVGLNNVLACLKFSTPLTKFFYLLTPMFSFTRDTLTPIQYVSDSHVTRMRHCAPHAYENH